MKFCGAFARIHINIIFAHFYCAMAKPMSAFPRALCAVRAHRPNVSVQILDRKWPKKKNKYTHKAFSHIFSRSRMQTRIYLLQMRNRYYFKRYIFFLAFIVFLSFWPVFDPQRRVQSFSSIYLVDFMCFWFLYGWLVGINNSSNQPANQLLCAVHCIWLFIVSTFRIL